ncbi:MAG: hypothetical protein GY816_04585, partial [Cytophagales bacterium]|nr:hypothetical protein [Cytophagales bacterium]
GQPIYYNNDEYGAIDLLENGQHSIYYIRIRAAGIPGESFKEYDNRYGEWSDPIAVRLNKSDRLATPTFVASPDDIDLARDEGSKLLPQGEVPLIWSLNKEYPVNPSDEENHSDYPLYAVITSQNSNVISDNGRMIQGDTTDYSIDYVAAEDLGVGLSNGQIFPGDPHYIKVLFDGSSSEEGGDFYFWVQALNETTESIPSLWSASTHVVMAPYAIPEQPILVTPQDM